ncbi:ATP-binding response regulator [Desulfoferrobacter suflitae]|uniref:ATP-binding response regulator n=1 Tax=Desulfoferrobacter suflitae TaxID=2865782 RepID=UPI00216456A5|nr:response regulator [Desulfoferrobacter suflitae]MCK8600945.1 response regulator [Desulfoferrobacter suflitae]
MVRKDWKLLLIDDDPGIRKVMSIALQDAGYEVLTAADGESGVALCGKERPKIVITDIRMPGIDGIEVLKRIKELDTDVEVIVITAFSEIELAIKALQLDASDFITKPINDDALWVALKRAEERYTTRKDLKDYTALIEERWMETAEELAKTFHFQRNLIESSIDGIIACDSEGRVLIFNKSMEQMLGYSKDKVVDRMSLYQFFSLGEVEKFYKKLYAEEYGGRNRLYLYESTLISKAGNKIPVQLSATVLFQEEEEIGVVGFFRDLRDIRKMAQQFADQARLLHQDKMISLGKLAASVVHEINNPLSGILNYTRLMIKILSRGALSSESTEKFQSYLGLMESEISRCSKIVSNLLAFSRKSRLEFSAVDINELLKKCILLSEHKLILQNIRITTRLQTDMPMVLGDFSQLQQCVINLIFNAIDAMPRGGDILIESSFNPDKKVVEVAITDNGVGIAKEDLNYIFDPFFTTKKEGKGLGLGLSTVYGIIDRHKGAISVQSEVGKGTRFALKLPLKQETGEVSGS